QGAKLASGGTYEQLFYRPTVLADVPLDAPAFAEEVFGPVAPVTRVTSVEQAAELAADSEYGLSLGIVTRDAMRGLAVAEKIPTGIVHINDQTVNDEANAPFGGIRASGTGSRFGGATANMEAFTETRWITMRGEPPTYPFCREPPGRPVTGPTGRPRSALPADAVRPAAAGWFRPESAREGRDASIPSGGSEGGVGMGIVSPGFHGRRRGTSVELPPGQYLTEDFPVLSAGPTPRIDKEDWTFTVTTESGQEYSWDWDQFMELPSETPDVDIHCV